MVELFVDLFDFKINSCISSIMTLSFVFLFTFSLGVDFRTDDCGRLVEGFGNTALLVSACISFEGFPLERPRGRLVKFFFLVVYMGAGDSFLLGLGLGTLVEI